MELLEEQGFTEDEFCRLKRVRLHQHVLFLSCVLGASGKFLDRKYMRKRRAEEPNKDFELWKTALREIVPVGGVQDKLGKWVHQGFKHGTGDTAWKGLGFYT